MVILCGLQNTHTVGTLSTLVCIEMLSVRILELLKIKLFPNECNLTVELSEAVRANNQIRFGLYHSLLEWYNPMYLRDKDSGFTQNEFVEKKVILVMTLFW